MEEKEIDCLGIGRSCLDYLALVGEFPEKNSKIAADEFIVEGGGQAATAMVTLARLGARAKLVGKVGDDTAGKIILSKLKNSGVDVNDVEKSKNIESPQALIIVEKNTGQRTIVYQKPGETLSKNVPISIIKNSKSVLIDPQETEIGQEIARVARKNNIPVIYDAERAKPGIEKLISQTTHLVCDEDFSRDFTGKLKIKESLRQMLKLGPDVVIVTLGERGSVGLDKNGLFIEVDAYKIKKVIDTTGAGDAYHGAFIFGLINKWKLQKTMSFASVVAGLNCRALGGRRGLPQLKEALKAYEAF